MSVSSSSSSNASSPPLPPPHLSPSFSIYREIYDCFNSTTGAFSIMAFTLTSILLLLPLYIFVLYLGLRQWKQHHSNRMMRHSDVFTYHMVTIELVSILGSTFVCCGVYSDQPLLMTVGLHLFCINMIGQVFLHILTCLERYLAVVHPITYRNLKTANGIRVRSISIACVWLWCFAGTSHMHLEDRAVIIIFYLSGNTLTFATVSFWSLSVFCVLIRPGPGEVRGGQQQADQSKLRAFYTIMAILGVLLFRFGAWIINTALYASPQLGETVKCSLWLSLIWICMPSSLVLPLLFLHRAGKLLCCKNSK